MNDTNTEPMVVLVLLSLAAAIAVPAWAKGEVGVLTWVTTAFGGLLLVCVAWSCAALLQDHLRGR